MRRLCKNRATSCIFLQIFRNSLAVSHLRVYARIYIILFHSHFVNRNSLNIILLKFNTSKCLIFSKLRRVSSATLSLTNVKYFNVFLGVLSVQSCHNCHFVSVLRYIVMRCIYGRFRGMFLIKV